MESVNHDKSLYINNLLPFMNKEYLIKILIKFKEIKEINVENNPLELPGNISFLLKKKLEKNFLKKINK